MRMTKYVKRPIVVEAYQFPNMEVPDWMLMQETTYCTDGMYIKTLEDSL